MLRDVYEQFLAHVNGKHGSRFMPSLENVLTDVKAMLNSEEAAILAKSHIVIVDARGPQVAKPPWEQMLQDHCGTHPRIMEQVMVHSELIADIGRQLDAQWPKQGMALQDDIGVIVFFATLASTGQWPGHT